MTESPELLNVLTPRHTVDTREVNVGRPVCLKCGRVARPVRLYGAEREAAGWSACLGCPKCGRRWVPEKGERV